MKFVQMRVECIGSPALDREAARRWLDSIGAQEFQLRDSEVASDAAQIVELAGRRCYMAFKPGLNPNVTKIRTELIDYIDNILKSRHGSVIEHMNFTFAIEGISRVMTAELNRHRAGAAISEGSMRYIRFRNIDVYEPRSIRLDGGLLGELEYLAEKEDVELRFLNMEDKSPHIRLAYKKWQTQETFRRVFEMVEKEYSLLQSIWEEELAESSKFRDKKNVTSMMRRIIPMGVATGGIWTWNLRAQRHILEARNSEAAEEEILEFATTALKLMRDKEPLFFGDFEQRDGYWMPKYSKV